MVDLPEEALQVLAGSGSWLPDPVTATYGLLLNTRTEPFTDPNVRLALRLAIDTQAVTEAAGELTLRAAPGLIPYGISDYGAAAPVEEEEDATPVNQIFLDGYICKLPVYRKTPLGREIADLLLAVNRPYGKSDYIPCICWGRNARFASSFEVGEHVQVIGRIQSREYIKRLSETETQKRTAYEVSVSKLECPDSE